MNAEASGGANETRRSVGLVLGAGAARGWAHIGVIEALRERSIPIDVICGCSSGAIVAAAYATGRFDELSHLARSLDVLGMASYFDFSLDPGGLIEGRQIVRFFEDNLPDVSIDSTSIPFGAVATDLHSGREVWFTHGSIVDAVRASIALPGLLSPIRLNDRWLVDGGLVNPLPASLGRALGADILIAVNLTGDLLSHPIEVPTSDLNDEEEEQSSWLSQVKSFLSLDTEVKEEKPPYLEVLSLSQLVMNNFITRVRLATDPIDLLLAPDVESVGAFDFHKADVSIDAGKRAVEQCEDALAKVLQKVQGG